MIGMKLQVRILAAVEPADFRGSSEKEHWNRRPNLQLKSGIRYVNSPRRPTHEESTDLFPAREKRTTKPCVIGLAPRSNGWGVRCSVCVGFMDGRHMASSRQYRASQSLAAGHQRTQSILLDDSLEPCAHELPAIGLAATFIEHQDSRRILAWFTQHVEASGIPASCHRASRTFAGSMGLDFTPGQLW